jgi:hypothetical protein
MDVGLKPDSPRGDFPQGGDGFFVFRAFDEWMSAFHQLARAPRGQHDQREAVINLLQAIFDGNSSHNYILRL